MKRAPPSPIFHPPPSSAFVSCPPARSALPVRDAAPSPPRPVVAARQTLVSPWGKGRGHRRRCGRPCRSPPPSHTVAVADCAAPRCFLVWVLLPCLRLSPPSPKLSFPCAPSALAAPVSPFTPTRRRSRLLKAVASTLFLNDAATASLARLGWGAVACRCRRPPFLAAATTSPLLQDSSPTTSLLPASTIVTAITTTMDMGTPPPTTCHRRSRRGAPPCLLTPHPLLRLALLTAAVLLPLVAYPLLPPVTALATTAASAGVGALDGGNMALGFVASRLGLPRTTRALRTAEAAAACGNTGDTCRCAPPAAPPVRLCLRPGAAPGACDAGVCAPGWACDCAGDGVCAVARTAGVLACTGGGDGVGGCACGRVREGGWGLVRVGEWASPGGGGRVVEDRGGGVACGMPDGFWA